MSVEASSNSSAITAFLGNVSSVPGMVVSKATNAIAKIANAIMQGISCVGKTTVSLAKRCSFPVQSTKVATVGAAAILGLGLLYAANKACPAKLCGLFTKK